MKIFKEINALRTFLHDEKVRGIKNIGFIPTMGALHDGHLSLLKTSKFKNHISVCSIFVNPTQFNNSEDLEKYPRPIENDIKLLIENGCDVLFLPEVSEMYSKNELTNAEDFGIITNSLEGKYRSGHFDGVINIVKKLFEIIEPENAYFGQKDYQQCMVIEYLIKKNNFNIQLHICPTLREQDGLAMSSRNVRLNTEERKVAFIIPKTLLYIKENIRKQPFPEILLIAQNRITLSSNLLKIEYLEIVDAKSIKPLTSINETKNAIALIAAWCGNVRLIDNIILTD